MSLSGGQFSVSHQGSQTAPAMGEGCELPLDFNIGAVVACEDGGCGKLVRVVIDPVTENVTHLVVERGFILKDLRVVPISAIKGTTEGTVQLGFQSRGLDTFRRYRETDYRMPTFGLNTAKYNSEDVRYSVYTYQGLSGQAVVPASKHHLHKGVPFDMKVVGHGTEVSDLEGRVGQVDHVLVDCTEGHITHLVVYVKPLGRFVIVPVATLVSVEDA
ncbi:MAG: PRC-barrel domain-containing protein, partial [Anaerolineae bacterium]|nr:PRC-barrel domain-containing protein [Anaerolineae bacterium]